MELTRTKNQVVNQENNVEPLLQHKFIQVPPDLIKHLGKNLYLDLEKHYGQNSILMITIPNCSVCANVAVILDKAQNISKKNNQTFLIYSLMISDTDICSQSLHRDMGITKFPALYAVDSKGKMKSWVPRFLQPTENDPSGIGRITAVRILESFNLATT